MGLVATEDVSQRFEKPHDGESIAISLRTALIPLWTSIFGVDLFKIFLFRKNAEFCARIRQILHFMRII